ncbi:CWFJ domain-containing protein [Pochonia chlamydosporia 170]|uniref:CWFJ domain-containing protein n=1 Tax=Pochonia chlamydosporia 170 TaxID=1380566 RepID=A0A179G4Q5_METCM|nr:CWFJ domain-containing protein [Pochonia chlamydosporia 170]OAQ72500.1 CWFJ domain-containing protein [Pochonia chlamydosporia 170]
MAAPKIIVLGSLNGQLEPALKKLATLHAKNSFSLAILTGDVFTPSTDDATVSALLDGTLEVPLPTYFTIGTHSLPPRIATKVEAEEEICHNLHFLGKRSITKTSDGLRIVALGGLLDTNVVGGQSKEQHLPFHTDDDAKGLRGANSADILLTSMWPANVWNGSKITLEASQQAAVQSTQGIAELCAALKPRYHISSSPSAFFYEREPFVHPSSSETEPPTITRFISMAPYGNEAKAKAMYAFTLNKSDASVPPGVTASPFTSHKKRARNDDSSYSRFGHHDNNRHGRHNKRRRASPPPGPDKCYFCLSNPNISAHMCCSVGDESYVTTAKGPLPTPTTFSDAGLSFSGHLIIIPLPHAPTIPSMGATADPSSDAVRSYNEMTRFRESIQAMIASKTSYKLGVVTWEISRDRNIHLIWQLIPLPAEMIRNDIAEAAFRVEAENQKYPSFTTRELSLEEQPTFGDYFRVWLWADNGEDKIKGKSLVMPLASDMRFDLQFGRRVIAKLLGLEDRFIWQDCEQTVEEETADVEAFREAFKEWDFTLE